MEEEILKDFREFYEIAKKQDWILKPVSWALYKTWRKWNSKEKPRTTK